MKKVWVIDAEQRALEEKIRQERVAEEHRFKEFLAQFFTKVLEINIGIGEISF
jgi:hypothetical protein